MAIDQPARHAALRIVPPPDGKARDLRAVASHLGGKLVVSPAAPPGSVEQYRKLAATLHHAHTQSGVKVVMIGSALPGEGKTLTATNLAVTLSESYRRTVLIIDADLRRPTMHDIFQIPNIAGLNEALAASGELPPAFALSPRLTLLPAGRPNPDPMGLLTSAAMRDLVKSAAAGFDWVVIDTPPVGLLTDANLLARIVDAVVMVVAAGTGSYRILQRAADALGRDRIIGVVLNRAAEAPFGRAYGYEGYYGRDSGHA